MSNLEPENFRSDRSSVTRQLDRRMKLVYELRAESDEILQFCVDAERVLLRFDPRRKLLLRECLIILLDNNKKWLHIDQFVADLGKSGVVADKHVLKAALENKSKAGKVFRDYGENRFGLRVQLRGLPEKLLEFLKEIRPLE